MKTSRGQSLTRLLACVAFFATMPGCTFGFKSLSMDSTSKMPFMNFELRERKPKNNGPVYNSISLTEPENAQIKPALQTENSSSRSILNLGLKNPFSTKSAGNSTSDSPQSAQPQSSIAIPLTFVEAPTDRRSNESTLDFQ